MHARPLMGTLGIEFNEKGVAARGRGVSTSVASHPGMAVLIDLCKLDIRAVFFGYYGAYTTHIYTLHEGFAVHCTAAFQQDRSRKCA